MSKKFRRKSTLPASGYDVTATTAAATVAILQTTRRYGVTGAGTRGPSGPRWAKVLKPMLTQQTNLTVAHT
jgi:hypothetical protein